MKNTFGSSVSLTVFGESHGDGIGVVIDGLAPGIELDLDYIDEKLSMRAPYGKISTARHDSSEYKILSGVFGGYTTGTPIAIVMENCDTKSKDYSQLLEIPRPSHADFTAGAKYHGFQDYRGGGHFSGRITAPIVAGCAVISSALLKKGIKIGTHIKELHGACDRDFLDFDKDIAYLNSHRFPALSSESEEKMMREIERASEMGDSVGGILETVITGIPAGVGEPFFDSMESVLSHLLFSVGGVKGVEFGLGFAFADCYGSCANDAFVLRDGRVQTETNNNAGINGGITNGMPIVIKTAVKPTPSVFKAQKTLNLKTGKQDSLSLTGRHDPAIIHRVRAVVDALLALGVADMLAVRFGTDFLR